MTRIETYISSVYKNVKGNQNEIEDLKQDMRNHLLQTAEELKAEGKSEEESIEIAISRFGERSQVENELAEIFKVQRKFATTLLIVSLVSILLSVICFISYKAIDGKFTLKVPQSLITSVEYKLNTGETISSEEVNRLLKEYKKQFRYVAIYKENNVNSPDVIYPSNFSLEEVQNDESTLTTYVTSPNGDNWRVKYGFDIEGFNLGSGPILLNSAIILFVVYWLLFGIWCVINAYHRKKLSLVWVIIFFIFNVVAYVIFLLDGRNLYQKD